MKTLLLSLFIIFFINACGGGSSSPSPEALMPERIKITGAGDLGIFDPSVTRDPDTGRWWMSYSSVDTSIYHDPTTYWAVSIRLAWSDDDGVSWTDGSVVVAPNVETLVGPMTENHPTGDIPAMSKGTWQSEMSSLIYDPHPSTPANERWKLIWVQYLHVDATSYFADHSWIAMKMAATPTGLEAATPVKLFGGAGLQSDGSNTGSPVFSPTGGTPAIQLNMDLPQSVDGPDVTELNLCIFAEPGLNATNSTVYLAIFCADASTVPITEYLVYFRCSNPCTMTNATGWEYLGRLLSPTDALAATGDHHYQAPGFVEKNGSTYLLVTPVDTTSGDGYSGCRVYAFNDVNSNQLRRTNGQLVEVNRIDGEENTHNGACAAFSGIDGGILLSQFGTRGTADAFKIINSHVSLP